MVSTDFEYTYIIFTVLSTSLLLLILSLIGYGTTTTQEAIQGIEAQENFNILTGLQKFYTNPLIGGWEKIIYSILIITPFSVFITIFLVNLARGR